MKNIVLKKFNLFILCGLLLFCSLIFVGCGNPSNKNNYENQGFIAVCEVNYTTSNGTNQDYEVSLNSYYTVSYSIKQEITEEEFNSSSYEYCESNSRQNFSSDNKIEYSIGETYRSYDYNGYYLIEINDIQAYYLYVKILDGNKFELIDLAGDHYIINTSYYNIKYFI